MTTEIPRLMISPDAAYIESGTQVTLTCMTEATGTLTYTFNKGDDIVWETEVGENNVYVIENPDVSHTGIYKCVVTVGDLTSESSSHHLNIVGKTHEK